MDLEKTADIVLQTSNPKDLVEKLENIEITSESFDNQMACLQYFSYILTWDIVNARFFFYKYQKLIESLQIGKEMTKFLKLIFENKYSELIQGCEALCVFLNSQPSYKKWINELKKKVRDHLNNLVEKNFTSINATRLSSYGVDPENKAYVKIEQKEQEKTPIDIEKLSQIARLIQNMDNK